VEYFPNILVDQHEIIFSKQHRDGKACSRGPEALKAVTEDDAAEISWSYSRSIATPHGVACRLRTSPEKGSMG